ncbi:NHLP family bacteriocin export ABC transporter peptidase/permease/ATPase subunit [Sphingorhabdus sp. Alg231-15]|uniref:NHLP family bacteriocin export ABC transporter peptidase/permease/ATPase subunit n=1 Tax=Sphingorhabdus sp. Alg231-15 TaxID=1922222 RepID=UPI000D54F210
MNFFRKKPPRTPTILQMEAAECGAASLAMILGTYDRYVPLEELRGECGISRDGAKASNILKAARKYNLESKGLKVEPENLEDLNFPIIAFVNFNHFLVVEGIVDGEVYINDPASGHRTEPMEEFALGYTGVVLTFAPTEDFVRGDDRPSMFVSLINRVEDYRGGLLFIFLVSLALVVPGIVIPFFTQIFVDYVLVRSLDDWLWPLLIGMTITAVLRFGLIALQEISLVRLGAEMKGRTGFQLLQHMIRLPINFFEQRFTGEIADRVRLNEGLVSLLSEQMIQAAINLLLAIFYLIVLLYFSVPLTLIIVGLASLNIAILLYTTATIAEKYRKVSIDQGKLMGARIAGLKDIETYKASGGENMLFTRWTGLQAKTINGVQEATAVQVWTGPVPALLSTFIMLTTLIGGGYMVMQGNFTLGELVAYQALAMSFSGPITALASFGSELQQLRTFLGRLDDTLDQQVDPAFEGEEIVDIDRLPKGSVRLVEASFGYNPLDPPLIDSLSIDIAPGQRIALVGASGSGKSTVGKMIGGLVDLQAGQIEIDGRARRQWPRHVLASRLAFVRQDVMLFNGTVRDNLSLWDKSIGDVDMIQAATDAAIHDRIMAWPGGYEAPIASGATNISGGEKQRLEIARALATNPSVIILDEATSALDPVSEFEVMEAIRRRGLTCIVIAHRLSTIRDCDEIIVLDRGQIIERGTHSGLLQEEGAYARLLEA